MKCLRIREARTGFGYQIDLIFAGCQTRFSFRTHIAHLSKKEQKGEYIFRKIKVLEKIYIYDAYVYYNIIIYKYIEASFGHIVT